MRAFMRGSGRRRAHAAKLRNIRRMRILLVPLLFAVAVVAMLAVLATPPEAVPANGTMAAATHR